MVSSDGLRYAPKVSFLDLTLQATISVVLLVDPFIRSVFFRVLTENEPERRREYVSQADVHDRHPAGGLGADRQGAARPIGIDLNAFGIVGGLVLVLMGFEMLAGGEPSRAQGGEKAREQKEPAERRGPDRRPLRDPLHGRPGGNHDGHHDRVHG